MNNYYIPYGYRESGTYCISFYDTSLEILIKELLTWGSEYDWSYHISKIPNELLTKRQFDELDNLARTNLFIPTKNRWTAHVDNGLLADCPHSMLTVIAERLHIQTVTFVFDSLNLSKNSKRPYGIKFVMYDGRMGSDAQVRSIELIKDSSWEFHTYGSRLEFEQLEAYDERLKKNRLTPQLLIDYANALDIDIESSDYYRILDAVLAEEYVVNEDNKGTRRLIQELIEIGFEFGAKSVQFFSKNTLESKDNDK